MIPKFCSYLTEKKASIFTNNGYCEWQVSISVPMATYGQSRHKKATKERTTCESHTKVWVSAKMHLSEKF